MKAFISYKFTGEKQEDLNNLLVPVQNKLKEVGVDAYCNLFDEEFLEISKSFKQHDFLFHAFKVLDEMKLLFVIINSEEKSEGMILEVGYSLAKGIPVVVAVKEDIKNTYLPGMANAVIQWSNVSDLISKIGEVDFNGLISSPE